MVDIQPKLVVIAACGQPSKSPYTLKYFSPSIWWKRLCFIIIIIFFKAKESVLQVWGAKRKPWQGHMITA